MSKTFASLACASTLALSIGMIAAPGTASAGFFDQLFGTAPVAAPAPAPSYGYDEPSYSYAAPVRHHVKKKVAVVDSKPKLQKTTDLMRDVTLRNGDAVMMKGGIHVYMGGEREARHDKSDFEPLDAVSGVPKQERNALVAMDLIRNDPLRGALTSDTVASGRSAVVATPISAGRDIVDARGKSVRYVGP